MKLIHELTEKKKKKYKNGLSITPFVLHKEDAGDVEKGIQFFNGEGQSATGSGEAGAGEGSASAGACEALAAGNLEKAEEIRKDIQWYEEKEDDQPYNSNRYDDKIKELNKELNESNPNIKFEDAFDRFIENKEVRDSFKEAEKEFGKVTIEPNKKEELNKEKNMEDIKESLDNVSEVEEKSKEVVDPAFAAAVRSIKDNDEKRDEAVELMDAPKEGEETLSKDLKFTLDESLFEEYQEAEVLEEACETVNEGEEIHCTVKPGEEFELLDELIEKYGDSGLLNLIAIRLGKEKLGEVLAGICESGDIHSEYLN